MKSAKQLCAMLITRSLKDLTEEEEDIVVDYLEDIGIETDIDANSKELCLTLLEKTMQEDLGRRVPLTAYANSLLTVKEEKITKDMSAERKQIKNRLENQSGSLPGCIVADMPIFTKNLYDLRVDPELGIQNLSDGTSQYTSTVSVSENLYNKIFLNYETPVIELNTAKGNRGYARIGQAHSGADDLILVSPLVSTILNFREVEGAFVKLCMSLPDISKVGFTFYGNKEKLNRILPELINKLPQVVNAFSYLSLGIVLNTDINNENIQVRVDSLEDVTERPIFAGLVPFGESDLPFEIEADM